MNPYVRLSVGWLVRVSVIISKRAGIYTSMHLSENFILDVSIISTLLRVYITSDFVYKVHRENVLYSIYIVQGFP